MRAATNGELQFTCQLLDPCDCGLSRPLPQVCAQAPCSGCTPQEAPSVRNFRLLSWAQNSSFWQQGCTYDVSLPLGFVVTRQQPGKSSPISQWSFTFRTPDPQILQLAQVLQVSTESATVSIAWDSSVEFRCRVASLETTWQLAPREVPSSVDFTGLLPETRYDIECMARLQDEPLVVSSWLSAGQLQTEKDLNVELEELYLHVQPLCLSHSMESYQLPVTPTLQTNRTNYSVALPNADFALNCTQQEATWQLELRTKAQSQYATTEVTTDNGTTDVLMLTLPAEEVLVTSSFTVKVSAGCGCVVDYYHVQVMGLRLSFHVGVPSVTKATGDAVPLNQTEEGHRLQVSVSYDNDALPSSLWNSLSIYLGPFQQVTLAAPAESQTPSSQVYTLMTTLSAVGKDLPLQLRLAGALVGESSSNLSFAAPFVNCISTVGYGQCTAEELENKEVFVRTLGETMLYVKGVRHNTQPKKATYQESYQDTSWGDWDQPWEGEDATWIRGNAQSRSLSRTTIRSEKTDSGSKGPRYRKNQGKGKNKAKEQTKDGKGHGHGESTVSPFAPLTKELPAWPAPDSATSFSAATSSNALAQSQRDQEAVALLKQAYPDPTKMPAESKEFIEKVEKENAKAVTKNLHWTTRAMGRAQKTLAEALDSKKSHRGRWATHVSEAIKVWETQLQEYRQQQNAFQEVILKARQDIESYRGSIRSLTAVAAPEALSTMPPLATMPSEVEDLTGDIDQEEDKLQAHLQRVLRSCVESLGVNLTVQRDKADSQELPEEEDRGQNSQKRPRSMEPFAPSIAASPKEPTQPLEFKEQDAKM
eukprot:s495_g2.t1